MTVVQEDAVTRQVTDIASIETETEPRISDDDILMLTGHAISDLSDIARRDPRAWKVREELARTAFAFLRSAYTGLGLQEAAGRIITVEGLFIGAMRADDKGTMLALLDRM